MKKGNEGYAKLGYRRRRVKGVWAWYSCVRGYRGRCGMFPCKVVDILAIFWNGWMCAEV